MATLSACVVHHSKQHRNGWNGLEEERKREGRMHQIVECYECSLQTTHLNIIDFTPRGMEDIAQSLKGNLGGHVERKGRGGELK